MIKSLLREATLAVQARTGLTTGLVVGLAVALFAALTSFGFFCVAAFVWLDRLFGGVFAGLIAAGFFLLVAAIAAIASALARKGARERAILERAARGHAGSWLLDPKVLGVALDVGRSIGWQRILPVALLAFVAAQWTREYRGQRRDSGD